MQADLARLEKLMHPKVVFVLPDLKTKIEGCKACLQSVQEYADTAQTLKYEIQHQDIQTVGQASTVLLTYLVAYEMNEQRYQEMGSEVWNLVQTNGVWQMVWRGLIRSESVE